jgi:uncharacterized protein (DUF305 family)
MNKQTLTIGLALAFLGLGAGYALWGGAAAPSERHSMADGSMMGDIDQHFIVQMIPHHEGAIDMARLALERSTRAEVRTLAENIIAAQTKEIRDMSAWYAEWFGSAPPSGGFGMHMEGMEGDTEALNRAEEFDREFLSQMIVHHEMAVMMADMLSAGTERNEMKRLAEAIRTSQSHEIALMRGWLTVWYGDSLE